MHYFCNFITEDAQKMHRRCTQDTQIVRFEYGVGTAQTRTKLQIRQQAELKNKLYLTYQLSTNESVRIDDPDAFVTGK